MSRPLSCDEPNVMPYTLEETISLFKSGETKNSWKKPEDDAGSDYVTESDGSLSDCQSDDTVDSKDYDKLDNHWRLTNQTPMAQKEKDKSEDPLCEENSATLKKKLSETAVVPTSNVNEPFRDKRDYCLFCSKPVIQKARHLARIQSDDVEVEVMFQCPLHLSERQKIWKNDKNIFKMGKEQLVVRIIPSKLAKSSEVIHCIYCHGLFKKEHLFNHLKNCSEKVKKEDKQQGVGKPVISLCELLSENCDDLSEEFKNVLDKLEYDEVTEAVMENRTILQFGEHILSEAGYSVNKHEHIRQNLRDVARLVLEAQRSTPMKSLEDFFDPSNFLHVVSAVRVLAGFDPGKKTYTLPLLAHDLGYHLQIICSIVVRNAVNSCDFKVIESCKNFLSLYSKKWNRIISPRSRVNVCKTKRKNKKYVAVVGDVNCLRHAKKNVHRLDENKLMTCDDTDMESGVRVQPSSEEQVSTEHHSLVSSSSFGSSNPQQDHDVPTNMGPPHKSNKSKRNVIHDLNHRVKHRWNEAEIRAVEKHLMSFIEELRIPPKDDCVRCIEAEPHALGKRSWSVLREYVRNRIRVLKKQSVSERKLKQKRYKKKKPKQRFA